MDHETRSDRTTKGGRPWRLLAAGAMALVLGPASGAYAHVNQPDQADTTIVHACVKKSGVVRVINGQTQDCLKSETRTHWDLVGPEGPAGQQGEAGLAGEPGVGILGGSTANALLAGNIDQFMGSFNAGRSRTEAEVTLPIPTGGTFSNFYVVLSGPPGVGKAWTFVVRWNATDTPVTCTIADNATACNDTVHNAPYGSGDLFSIRVIGANNPTTRFVQWTGLFQPD